MKYLQLFDSHSGGIHSKAFTIFPGFVGVLSAYNLGPKVVRPVNESRNAAQKFIVQKLEFQGGGVYTKSVGEWDEDSELGFDPVFTYAEDVTQCGLWAITPCNNTGAIMLPGTYRVRLNDEGALGTAVLSLTRYSQHESKYVPRGMVFGD